MAAHSTSGHKQWLEQWLRWPVMVACSLLVHCDCAAPIVNNNVLEVFIIPHSHMDVGWVYTVNESMVAYAVNVYNTILTELSKNSERRFISVEQEFFRIWWDTVADENQKEQMHKLVDKGQLEFIIGGQVMNDEAVTEYSAIIQQLTEGHGFLYETFGVRPQFSWHVDPFGASATMPTLFSLAGFNAHLTSRINYDEKAMLMKKKGLQFVWQPSTSLGDKVQLFTHIMDSYSYCVASQVPFSSKPGFFWDGYVVFPTPPPDGHYPNMSLPVNSSTAKEYADFMVDNIQQRAAWFKTKHLLWPWGCDKQFYNATLQFSNMDPLMEYINNHSDLYQIKLHYATLGEYFTAIHEANQTWDLKNSGDFLPYASEPHAVWSGFYTSRNHLKGVARRAQALLNAGERLFAVACLSPKMTLLNKTWALEQLKPLRWSTAEVQHHDGITGTENPKVRDMYADHLADSSSKASILIQDILDEMTQNTSQQDYKCRQKASIPSIFPEGCSENGEVLTPIVVYNPLAWSVNRYVMINVSSAEVTLINSEGAVMASQINKVNHQGKQNTELNLYVELPPLGYQEYFMTASPRSKFTRTQGLTKHFKKSPIKPINNDSVFNSILIIGNKCLEIKVDTVTKSLISIANKCSGKTVEMDQDFLEYNSIYNAAFGPVSDNYIFRPNGSASHLGGAVAMTTTSGTYLEEVKWSYYANSNKEEASHVVTLKVYQWPNSSKLEDCILCNYIELEFAVGPLEVNKECIFRFKTNMTTGKTLYTDDNGYQMMKRTYQKAELEPIAQNYYPMVGTAYIEDENSDVRLTVLSERPHGVASLDNGQLEVMLHRRLINNQEMDLSYNLTLNDTSVVKPRLWLSLDSIEQSADFRHQAWMLAENPPLISIVKQAKKRPEVVSSIALEQSLPANIHLLTFKVPGWNYSTNHYQHIHQLKSNKLTLATDFNRILIQLHHMFEVGESNSYSKPVTLNLQKIFSSFGTLKSVEERSLTGIWDVNEIKSWKWQTSVSKTARKKFSNCFVSDNFTITLHPQEIRTFFLNFS